MARCEVNGYEPTIGLEVHARLLTRSKLFCSCPVRSDAPANSTICPTCLGYPGTLPRPNREAVRLGLRCALALGSTIDTGSEWARKSYFYPDLPRGYQITQHRRPLATGGALRFEDENGAPQVIAIERLHLEEDAGKSVHEGVGPGASGIDFNRAGHPLVEIVTQPSIRSPRAAQLFLVRMRALLKLIGACDAEMQSGSLRCDANVSLQRAGRRFERVEIKNLNSMRHVRLALSDEIQRQAELIDAGGAVERETRLWDERASHTRLMRGKEQARDYRYFPEPDLPPLAVDAALLAEAGEGMPELPDSRFQRYTGTLGLSAVQAATLLAEPDLTLLFERVADGSGLPQAAAAWVTGPLTAWLRQRRLAVTQCPIPPERCAEVVRLLSSGELPRAATAAVLDAMAESGLGAREQLRRLGLEPLDDRESLVRVCEAALADEPELTRACREGRQELLGHFIGRVMRATGSRADGRVVAEILRGLLEVD